MKNIRNIFYVAIMAIIFTSCEKVIELDLKSPESKLVVEGEVNNNPGPYFVKLSKSIQFDAPSNYPAIANATVTITDNVNQSETLTYVSNGLYRTNTLQGIEGRTYKLKIIADGITYEAQSTMPQKVVLDTIRTIDLQTPGRTNKGIIPVYTDPGSVGNNYRFVLTVNGKNDPSYFVVNDNTNNGAINARPLLTNETEIKSGNTVSVALHTIDNNVFNYYFTLQQMSFSGPGGGTTPTNPPNNISNGALGLFSAQTVQKKTIIVQ